MRSTISAITAIIGLCGVGAAATLTAPAKAEVTKQEDGVFVTRDSAVVQTDPEETWLALVAPNRWWSDSHTWSGKAENMYLSPQGGGCFCELLPKDEDAAEGIQRGSVQHMVVIQADPGKVLRMRGGLGPLQSEPAEGVLTVTLKAADGGTRILWEYVVGGYTRFDPETISGAVDGVMSLQLARLTKLLGAAEGTEDKDEADEQEASDEEASDKADDSDASDKDSEKDTSEGDDESDEAADNTEAKEDSDQRIKPRRVLTLEEAIDQMAGGQDEKDDKEDDE